MRPVQGGTTPIKMNSSENQYRERLAAAQGMQENAYVDGIRDVFHDGPGNAIKNTRGPNGAPRLTVGDMLQGDHSNFSQVDAPGNSPLANAAKQTGMVDTAAASTNVPSQDPEDMEFDALAKRMAMYQKKGYDAGLNNRAQTMSA